MRVRVGVHVYCLCMWVPLKTIRLPFPSACIITAPELILDRVKAEKASAGDPAFGVEHTFFGQVRS